MVLTYWQVGRLIVEDQQAGEVRAEYGKAVLEALAERLTAKFGKGFTVNNLRYMRQFYLLFPNNHALRDDLSWTRHLCRLAVKSVNPKG
jgi:predicted GNAT superfamily acetyltransferase